MKRLASLLSTLILAAGAPVALAQQPAAEKPAAEKPAAEPTAAEKAAADKAAAEMPVPAKAPKATSLDDLLQRVKQGWTGERRQNADREAAFAKAKQDQERLLREAKALRDSLERRSE
ncbi:MAG TPA: hypothetical protein VEC18_03875, partial [Myxococcota bacterium]|nr:hypothetical protein [Myxococcota bacterium]